MDDRLTLWHERSIPSLDLREHDAKRARRPRWKLALYAGAAVFGIAVGELILRA
jgi:hypothetical protein